jgi:hypothetical protein
MFLQLVSVSWFFIHAHTVSRGLRSGLSRPFDEADFGPVAESLLDLWQGFLILQEVDGGIELHEHFHLVISSCKYLILLIISAWLRNSSPSCLSR